MNHTKHTRQVDKIFNQLISLSFPSPFLPPSRKPTLHSQHQEAHQSNESARGDRRAMKLQWYVLNTVVALLVEVYDGFIWITTNHQRTEY